MIIDLATDLTVNKRVKYRDQAWKRLKKVREREREGPETL
jgi:hypothetical protein